MQDAETKEEEQEEQEVVDEEEGEDQKIKLSEMKLKELKTLVQMKTCLNIRNLLRNVSANLPTVLEKKKDRNNLL